MTHRHEWLLTEGGQVSSACCKHCDAYMGPDEIERRLNVFEQMEQELKLLKDLGQAFNVRVKIDEPLESD